MTSVTRINYIVGEEKYIYYSCFGKARGLKSFMQYVFVDHEKYAFVMSHNMLPNYLKFCIFLQYAYYVRPSILCTPLWNGPMQWDPMSSSLQYDIGQYPTFAKCNIMQYAHFTRPPCWRCASWA